MEATCTAHMSVAVHIPSNTVNVSYCTHHVGHVAELGHLRLTGATRSEVAALLQQGVTVAKIMDQMRDRLGTNLNRDILLCRKDVHNVKVACNVGCVQKNAEDHMSVDVWVEEFMAMGDDSPVILYKPQGADPDVNTSGLTASDFVLGLQTITQRNFMMEFGNASIICLDSTHGTNQYDFHLITVMVVDDFGEGNPVAFLIANREDETTLTCFFKALKSRLPAGTSFSASHVMTDDAGQYCKAWVAVFGVTDKKLCIWHVDRAWRRAIKEHVSGVELQIEIYHMLRSLLQELNEAEFRQCLDSFMQYLRDEAPNFATYFAAYCVRAPEWAYCYRAGIRANTNMYIESFHNVLKSVYMERKVNRRVDSLVSILMRIARDKAFERLIKVEKKSISKKLVEINRRHACLMEQLPSVTSGGWMVPSETDVGRQYFVAPAAETCSCSMHCSTCRCCPHMYNCSCVDFAVHATVCKHVHTVHSLLSRPSECLESAESAVPEFSSQNEGVLSNVDVELATELERTNSVVRDEVAALELDSNHSRASDEAAAYKATLHRLMASCRQLMASAPDCGSNDALNSALKHVRAAEATVRAAKRSNNYVSLTVRNKMVANRKLATQRRFFSTKAKRRLPPQRLHKPTLAKVNAVKNMLLVRATRPDDSESLLFTLSGCDEVPFCVDCEDVAMESVGMP